VTDHEKIAIALSELASDLFRFAIAGDGEEFDEALEAWFSLRVIRARHFESAPLRFLDCDRRRLAWACAVAHSVSHYGGAQEGTMKECECSTAGMLRALGDLLDALDARRARALAIKRGLGVSHFLGGAA
jgi:hypothetical protein